MPRRRRKPTLHLAKPLPEWGLVKFRPYGPMP